MEATSRSRASCPTASRPPGPKMFMVSMRRRAPGATLPMSVAEASGAIHTGAYTVREMEVSGSGVMSTGRGLPPRTSGSPARRSAPARRRAIARIRVRAMSSVPVGWASGKASESASMPVSAAGSGPERVGLHSSSMTCAAQGGRSSRPRSSSSRFQGPWSSAPGSSWRREAPTHPECRSWDMARASTSLAVMSLVMTSRWRVSTRPMGRVPTAEKVAVSVGRDRARSPAPMVIVGASTWLFMVGGAAWLLA